VAPPPLWNRVVSRLYNCRADSETFAQIKINFRERFKELFGEKGEADLNLIDANEPLESGIEITAKPPGKKLQSITLLSGGVTMEEFGVSKPVGMRLTAGDGQGNKTEAKSAAQKAALRLDA
jgi:hypothetical protein